MAKVKAIYSNVTAAANLANYHAIINDLPTGSTTIILNGTSITMNYRYPTADQAGIIAAANLGNENNIRLGTAITNQIIIDANLGQQALSATLSSCEVSYVAPTSVDGLPTISFITSGC